MFSRFSTWIIEKFSQWLTKKVEPKCSYLSDYGKICQNVKPADVILISGRRRVSQIIRSVTQSAWSHAALYIGCIDDLTDPDLIKLARQYYKGSGADKLLVESEVGQGTVITPLRHYKDEHSRIARPTSLTPDDANKVIAYALHSLGKEYSIRHVLDLARFIMPWSIFPRRWRSSLFSHHALKPTEEICSAMLARAFASVNYPILPLVEYQSQRGYELTRRNPNLFTPSDFDYSPYFEIIKYPIFGDNISLPYHNLPWKKNEVSHE